GFADKRVRHSASLLHFEPHDLEDQSIRRRFHQFLTLLALGGCCKTAPPPLAQAVPRGGPTRRAPAGARPGPGTTRTGPAAGSYEGCEGLPAHASAFLTDPAMIRPRCVLKNGFAVQASSNQRV